jgi:Skp family chaperone for outer membrane proteins
MKKTALALMMFATGGLALALAQNAPADLVAAYKAGVAAEKCGLNLASDVSSQLGDAVQRAEQRSGLAQGDLDALYAKTQSDADADNAGFCANAGAQIEKVIAAAK